MESQSGQEPPVQETPPTRETLRRWDPERIGPYVVLGRLGSGSMGQVYLGRSAAGRLVAVKTIRVELAEEAGFRHRFAQEVAAARKVSGVFTAAVVEADPEADLPWLATAYVPAPSLARLVTACGPLPVTTVRWLAAGCAEALASIHGAGLVHRDLKPSNVLVAPDGPRVIDFGVARAAERMGRTTSRGAVGTPAYMAPEQARDTHEASVASDVYSLGATLLFAATGHPPYQGVTVMDVLARLATEEPDLSGLPGELTELVTSCMHRVPRQRPTSSAMLAQLGDFTEAQAGPDEGHAYLPAAAMALIEEYQRSPQLAALSEPDDDRSSDATAASYTELPASYKPVSRRRPGTGSPGAGESGWRRWRRLRPSWWHRVLDGQAKRGEAEEPVRQRVPGYSSGPGKPPGPGATSQSPGQQSDRYLVGEFPDRASAGAEVSLIVSITSEVKARDLAVALLPSLAVGPEGVAVTIVVRPSSGLVTLEELQQTIIVPPYGDGSPVRFAFRANAVGLSRVNVTSWLGGTFLAELRLEISVESDIRTTESQRRRVAIGALEADPGEVTLQVHSDGAQYSFQLLSQHYLFGPVLAKSLTERPGQAVERTVAMLRKMASEASGYSPALAARWVRETGTGLWQDLVPRLVQDQFWELRDSITSFTIACDDDTVPWELLYPLTPGNDSGFLVEQFPVLRRVYDQRRSHQVWLGDAKYVVPSGSPGNAQEEIAAIRKILAQPASPTIADLASLLELLDTGSTGMLHFACHSTFSLETGGSSIKMADGAFVPQLLNSAVGRRCLAGKNPLILSIPAEVPEYLPNIAR